MFLPLTILKKGLKTACNVGLMLGKGILNNGSPMGNRVLHNVSVKTWYNDFVTVPEVVLAIRLNNDVMRAGRC